MSTRGTSRDTLPDLTLVGALRLGLLIGLWVGSVVFAYKVVGNFWPQGGTGYDAHAYWAAVRADQPYGALPGERDAYLYSPAFLHVLTPVALLPWWGFFGVWATVEVACFWWVMRGLAWWWRVPLLLLCTPELIFGNVYGLLAVMAVVGLRRPGVWAFAFLTKVSLGLVPLVWFAVRREWRALAEVLGTTAVVVVLSAAVDLQAWFDWGEFLLSSSGEGAVGERMVRWTLAVVVVAWGARSNRPWVLPVGLFLSLPHFTWKNKDFSVLVGAPAFAARARQARDADPVTPSSTTAPDVGARA